ncbi:MAG: dihydrodipicolinate synthase family protein [Rhodoplanes sp.]
MAPKTPRGVIAAIATAVDQDGEPDCARSVALARHLLAHGCDGLNVLGTTGEATSFSVAQRQTVMNAYAGAELPLSRCLVGTGAAALADAVTLTSHAAELGFGGALLLPPFYYKDIADDGLFAYVERIIAATAARPICLYLYHFPALSTVPWPLPLVGRMIEAFGPRLRGLKDSSGDMGYARAAAALAEGFSVFPSTEGALVEARAGRFAGCISATANLNSDLCALAYHHGDAEALAQAVAIRRLLDGKPVVAGVKALLGHIHADPAWARVAPPLSGLPAADRTAAIAGYDRIRAPSRAA